MKNSNRIKSLPWWVELLFVQIGLPDKWLRTYLKTRKKVLWNLTNNKRYIGYGLISLFIVVYINPIIKQASTHNQCIKNSEKIVKDRVIATESYSNEEIKALSSNFCNGGLI